VKEGETAGFRTPPVRDRRCLALSGAGL